MSKELTMDELLASTEIKELKSLMVPVRKDDKDPMVQKSKDIDNTKEELHTKNKKWWHFGRNVK